MEFFAEVNVATVEKGAGMEPEYKRRRVCWDEEREQREVQEVSTPTLKETKVGRTDSKGEAGIRHTSSLLTEYGERAGHRESGMQFCFWVRPEWRGAEEIPAIYTFGCQK